MDDRILRLCNLYCSHIEDIGYKLTDTRSFRGTDSHIKSDWTAVLSAYDGVHRIKQSWAGSRTAEIRSPGCPHFSRSCGIWQGKNNSRSYRKNCSTSCFQSTFATALQEHVAHFKRCNQDDLGNRRAVENLARKSLREGFSVCIDRTNFNPS